jgi:uncharacterized Fe-S cluster-containing radical SAM superfamily protein
MKILGTDNSYSELYKNKGNSFSRASKKKEKANEFRKILEQTMSDQSEDWEEFRVLLPKLGHFWDNGYEDLD